MIRKLIIYVAAVIGAASASLSHSSEPQSILTETDPAQFYIGIKSLVLSGEWSALAGVIQFPLATDHGGVQSREDFLQSPEAVVTDGIRKLFECAQATDVVDMGYRGYMVSAGGIWLGAYYFGELKASKYDPDSFTRRLNDISNWHFRLTALFEQAADCTKLGNDWSK